MDSDDYKSISLYFGREKYYQSMQSCSLEGFGKHPGDLSFRLFNGFALVFGSRFQEGIRELGPVLADRDLKMAGILTLIYAHKRCNTVDKEAVVALESKLKEERKKYTTTSLYYAAVFLFFHGKFDKARDYVDKSLKLNPNNPEAMVLKGWTELLSGRASLSKTTLELFDTALTLNKSIDANLGQMKFYHMSGEHEMAINISNKLSVRYPDLWIPLIEKMKIQMGSWNLEHAMETASRILNLESTNIDALRLKTINLICRDGNYMSGVLTLQYLFKALEKSESSNSELFYQNAQLFSRICGRQPRVLAETFKFAERAAKTTPGTSDYLTELGYQCVLQGRLKDATKYFRTATKLDDSSLMALSGLTLCQLNEHGPGEQVSQQIEFLTEIQGEQKIPILLFMTSKLYDGRSEIAIPLLIQACELHFSNLKNLAYGAEYLRIFDPDFLLQLTRELLNYSPIQPSVANETQLVKPTLHISLRHSLNILEAVVKACPGLVDGVFLLARVQFLCGEISAAMATLQNILQTLDATCTDAHLLVAQIHIQEKSFARAAQSLEICLSHNFKVRESPMYHLLLGVVQRSQEKLEEAVRSFLQAMTLGGISVGQSEAAVSPSKKKTKDGAVAVELSLADKVTLYLELISTYTTMTEVTEANRFMEIAAQEFMGTAEEGRIIIAKSDMYLELGNVAKALDTLAAIKSDQSYYLQAKTKMANIYLKYRQDRLLFAQCFKELVQNCPGPESYLMLGDAYMSIQEPEGAINAYTRAHKENPSDPMLASKLGRAYVRTHQYKKAISYYMEATANPENHALKLDLAELLLKLKKYPEAEQALMVELEVTSDQIDDLAVLQTRTKQLLLLARVREKAGDLVSSLSTLRDAFDNQQRLHQRLNLENKGALDEHRQTVSKICVLMAEQSAALRDDDKAIQYYKEALKYTPDELEIMASLARLQMQTNQMVACKDTCSSILLIDANNEVASVMMADLSFRKMDFESASYHFSQLLIAQPMYWTALARLIEVMRRAGTLVEAVPFLERGEQACVKASLEPGLQYCKGVYDWYTGNPNGSLRYFNNSRKDSEWGKQSIFNMIEICLNPDGDLPTEGYVDGSDEQDLRDSKTMALKTAERLLKELKPRPGGMDNEALNHRLLLNFQLLASHQRPNVEKALADFTAIASQDEFKDNVGAIFGMAAAHIIMKQPQRAKNQLKRVSKNVWTFEDAEYLERSWLTLAELYIQASKYDIAGELLQRVIEHNRSCAKAYELNGYIAEKEQQYRQAALHYTSAWSLSGKSKPHIGYKLAFNHMKNKKFADAIDICQQVLKIHPDYPSIRKDILDKCRNNLKS